MQFFKIPFFPTSGQHPGVLSTPDAKRIIKNYNSVAKVLVEFEIFHHQGWIRGVRTTKITT